MKNDQLIKTANNKIFVEQQENIPQAYIMAGLKRLDQAVSDNADLELSDLMKQLVPTYRDPEEVNGTVVWETEEVEVKA